MSFDRSKLKLSYCYVVWFLDISADCNAYGYGQCTDCKSNISVCSLCVNIVVQIA